MQATGHAVPAGRDSKLVTCSFEVALRVTLDAQAVKIDCAATINDELGQCTAYGRRERKAMTVEAGRDVIATYRRQLSDHRDQIGCRIDAARPRLRDAKAFELRKNPREAMRVLLDEVMIGLRFRQWIRAVRASPSKIFEQRHPDTQTHDVAIREKRRNECA